MTGEASDKCHKENRKTVNGDDICWALSSLGFDNYAEGMGRYLHKYREFERERANQNKANCGIAAGEEREEADEQIAHSPTALELRVFEKGGSSLTKPSWYRERSAGFPWYELLQLLGHRFVQISRVFRGFPMLQLLYEFDPNQNNGEDKPNKIVERDRCSCYVFMCLELGKILWTNSWVLASFFKVTLICLHGSFVIFFGSF